MSRARVPSATSMSSPSALVGSALAVAIALASAVGSSSPNARGVPAKPPPPEVGPTTSLRVPPRIRRVRFDLSPGGAVVTHDLVFARGALAVAAPGEATLFVAFTAQTRPVAVEATRTSLDVAGNKAAGAATSLTVVDVSMRPPTAALLLGAPESAGHVLRVPSGDAPFAIRIRTAVSLRTDARAREVSLLARLGVRGGAPLPLERIEIAGAGAVGAPVRGARAALCGRAADTRPMIVTFPGFPASPPDASTSAPDSVPRNADDDLCVDVLI